MGVQETDPLAQLSLPPGFRFYPTDEELLVQYLLKQVAGHRFSLQIIGEIDLYKHDPWVLPSKAIFGEREWYFFSPRERKYPNGSRPNRVAGSGYWKATGTDKIITTEGRKVGIKKSLVFYIGKAPKGTKTNWIMHEYRLLDSSRKNGSSKLDDWVLCRIYKKNSSSAQRYMTSTSVSTSSMEHSNNASLSSSSSSHIDDVLDSLPRADDQLFKFPIHENEQKVNINRLESGNFDWFTLAGLNSVPELGHTAQGHTQSQGMVNYQNYNASDAYIPSMAVPKLETTTRRYRNLMEEEEVVKGKTLTQRALNPVSNQQNSAVFPYILSNSVDRYGYPVLNQSGGDEFGFQQ